MSPNPFWEDKSELGFARRKKVLDRLMRSIEERKKGRPEPKEKPWNENAFKVLQDEPTE